MNSIKNYTQIPKHFYRVFSAHSISQNKQINVFLDMTRMLLLSNARWNKMRWMNFTITSLKWEEPMLVNIRRKLSFDCAIVQSEINRIQSQFLLCRSLYMFSLFCLIWFGLIQLVDEIQSRKHFLFLFFFLVWRAALVAVSKTSRTPSLVFAEHSRKA